MSDMSQDEIDAMLSGGGPAPSAAPAAAVAAIAAIEEPEAPPVSLYNFKNPVRFFRDQIKHLELVHESFAEWSSNSMSTYLRTEVIVKLKEIEPVVFHDYLAFLPNPTCLAVIDVAQINTCFLMHISSNVLYPIIDKLVGGTGAPPNLNRSFTDLELAIGKKIVSFLTKDLEKCWTYLATYTFKTKEVHTNPSFVRVFGARDLCMIVHFELTIGKVKGNMTIGIPYSKVDQLLSKRATEEPLSRSSLKMNRDQDGTNHLKKLDAELSVVLADLEIGMADLLYLQPGDILNLEKKIKDPIDVLVSGVKKFSGSPGLVGKHKGILIKDDDFEQRTKEA
ncbi:MAG: fliM [Chlamydiales bacterium]|nr:fliM [Chlamydiales bacterium]